MLIVFFLSHISVLSFNKKWVKWPEARNYAFLFSLSSCIITQDLLEMHMYAHTDCLPCICQKISHPSELQV